MIKRTLFGMIEEYVFDIANSDAKFRCDTPREDPLYTTIGFGDTSVLLTIGIDNHISIEHNIEYKTYFCSFTGIGYSYQYTFNITKLKYDQLVAIVKSNIV